MLLTVKGGGFFSSSASGYSKGLTLLLLGQRNEDKSMRVLPLSQFQLVGQESDHELQLASRKKRFSSRCASFVCFGCTSARLDTASHLKVVRAKHHDVSSGTLVSNKGKYPPDNVNDDNRKVALKSSLKGQGNKKPVLVEAVAEHEASGGKENDSHVQTERRKVQWTDACGSELVQLHEFEPRFSSSKPHSITIRSSQAEGPVRRPVAPQIREPSSTSVPPQLQKPALPSQTPPSPPSVVPPPQKPATAVGDGKNVITLEFQRQKAKELQEYFKQKKLEEANQGPFFGFIGKNEINNGRWAMFGFAVGLLTEFATGSDFVDQIKILLSNFGIVDLE